MAQQPNIVRKGAESLAPVAKPPSWTPTRAGEITKPQEAVTGPGFGVQGPDTGFAYRLVRAAEFDRCGRGDILEEVLVTLIGARAGKLGRAPAQTDLEVAKEILGIGDVRSAAKRRLQDLLSHTAHELRRGLSFVTGLEDAVLLGSVKTAERYLDDELG
jgi:hypothetical protein